MSSGPTATDAVRVALGLALGSDVPASPYIDWSRVYAAARAERLSGIAWLRSGDRIRQSARASVVAQWRADAAAAAELADRQLDALAEITAATESHGIRPLVLKGIPLSDRLYGDRSVRMCCDIDLLISEAERSRAHEILTNLGWQHWYGTIPFDASYRRVDGRGSLFLEVHSLLASEVMAHCRLTPDREATWSHDGLRLRTLDGSVLPVYLAVNLAKHGTPPLLSFLDLATLWAQLDSKDRDSAFALSARSRLARCFRWALACAAALPGHARADAAALKALGFHGDGRRSMHAFLRLIWLSDSPLDAARIVGTWTWPRSLRGTRGAIMPFWSKRMGRSFAGRFRYTRSYTAAGAQR